MSAKINDGLTKGQRYYRRHREKVLADQKARYDADPQYFLTKQKKSKARRTVWQRRSQGLPEPTRLEPPGCEKCGRTLEERKIKQALCADHCHKTMRFRGWLCTMCNIGIGNLGDDLEGVEQAADYLRRAL